jgi:hypothetical protein
MARLYAATGDGIVRLDEAAEQLQHDGGEPPLRTVVAAAGRLAGRFGENRLRQLRASGRRPTRPVPGAARRRLRCQDRQARALRHTAMLLGGLIGALFLLHIAPVAPIALASGILAVVLGAADRGSRQVQAPDRPAVISH